VSGEYVGADVGTCGEPIPTTPPFPAATTSDIAVMGKVANCTSENTTTMLLSAYPESVWGLTLRSSISFNVQKIFVDVSESEFDVGADHKGGNE